MQLKLVNRLRVYKSKVLLAALSAPVMILSTAAVPVAKSVPSLSRAEVHQYYVQGYRQGRASAMAKQGVEFQSGNLNSLSLPDSFYREYRRGYRDGYQMVVR